MKFLSLRDFEDVTSALNFNTPDCHVIGGCDLYTTKAAGSDKKLYKSIENSLESQYESLLRLSASLSPPHAIDAAGSLNLSRSSPFGPLSQISSRRTFAYLIATLNASHPDYDFSYILRPSDFRRERSLKSVMNTIDTTLYNLHPRPAGPLGMSSPYSATAPASGSTTPGGSQVWGPRMWRLIDKEMDLKDCGIFCYSPEEDPYDGEDGAIWSLNYFFFNKARKRVCYLYLRGLSVISHSPAQVRRRRDSRARSSSPDDRGASKRASYWLGDRAERRGSKVRDDADEDEIDDWDDSVVDADYVLDDGDELDDYEMEEEEEEAEELRAEQRRRSVVRGVSEDIAESMEV
ncbi:repressor of RNA polymerase III transcription MAF1 [Xylona heveae TC161]|uniref:Repressor of RNA polymerase III transcription MAF1 n=1 Tax=Xylona heveae (strain CBS 132557 / TC161) TaxID=1328760 RepID=A0A165HIS3_XYLHT|nr:repressor of RNA polymerase III transcription MAF1 [Xylona heveae TC161]KZF23581.1 repressor of RNA polymerase III transcription MAF1 [Xylona heveae TC161]